jgi:hypothetical protein
MGKDAWHRREIARAIVRSLDLKKATDRFDVRRRDRLSAQGDLLPRSKGGWEQGTGAAEKTSPNGNQRAGVMDSWGTNTRIYGLTNRVGPP